MRPQGPPGGPITASTDPAGRGPIEASNIRARAELRARRKGTVPLQFKPKPLTNVLAQRRSLQLRQLRQNIALLDATSPYHLLQIRLFVPLINSHNPILLPRFILLAHLPSRTAKNCPMYHLSPW